MRANNHQPLVSVVAELPATLLVTWADGSSDRVDLSTIIESNNALQPLAQSDLFQRARIGEWGWDVTWAESIDLSAAQLWRWAGEQAGDFMPVNDFRAWMERNRLTLSKAADALGLSRRMVAYYASGEKPIPRTILLACIGYDTLRRQAA